MRNATCAAAVGAGLAGLVTAGMSPAFATHTYVSVNGSKAVGTVPYTASKASPTIVFNTNYGVKVTCGTTPMSGSINRGTNVAAGSTIATISSASFTGCSIDGGFTVTMAMTGSIKVRTNPATPGDPINVTIDGIAGTLAATASGTCSLKFSGSLTGVLTTGAASPAANAKLTLDSSAYGPPETGFGLTISNVSGCGGEYQNGDTMGVWDSNKTTGVPSSFDLFTSGVGAGAISHIL